MHQVIVPVNIQAFMQAYGLDHNLLTGYNHTAVQKEITLETMTILQKALQVEYVTPVVMLGRSVRLLRNAITQISQQALLYNRLGQIANAFESVDLGWTLVEYGPDMISGVFDCVLVPLECSATAALYLGKTIAHPLKTAEMIRNGVCFVFDSMQSIGKKLYDGAQTTQQYIISHNPQEWYNDAGNLCTRSIDLMGDITNQAYDYLQTVDNHTLAKNLSSLGCVYFIMPLMQARTATAVSSFTHSIRVPLLEKTQAFKTASVTTLVKGMQKSKQLGYQAREKLTNLIKQADDIIQDLLPQTELVAHTPTGDIIKIAPGVTPIQKIKDQLFLLSEYVKEKANTILTPLYKKDFDYFNRSDIILPEVINSSGIRQIDAWKEATNKFKDLENLHDYHKLYLNYTYYLHHELEPLRKKIQGLNLSFYHGGKIRSIKDIDLLHVFLGDISPYNQKISGIHQLSRLTRNLYHQEQIPTPKSCIKRFNLFRKIQNQKIGAKKMSTVFPESWDLEKCSDIIISALQNTLHLSAELKKDIIIIKSASSSGIQIDFIYDPKAQIIKTCYPIL